jgi:hypothetical protein
MLKFRRKFGQGVSSHRHWHRAGVSRIVTEKQKTNQRKSVQSVAKMGMSEVLSAGQFFIPPMPDSVPTQSRSLDQADD